jgi:hypothetical protein
VGLEVAPHKTEAFFFHDGSRGKPPKAHIIVDGTRVGTEVGPKIKYFGLVLDGFWGFRPHFEALAPRVGIASKLSRFLPNVGGPGVKARSLTPTRSYLSVALYGAPVWADECPLLKLLAEQYSWTFQEARRLQREGHPPDPETILHLRREAWATTLTAWRQQLEAAVESDGPGHLVADAILPYFDKWKSRGRLVVSYRITQVLFGHGCFGEYLRKIGKERTPRCHHCAAGLNSALHTLAYCLAWAEECRVLTAIVGGEILSLGSFVRLVLEGEDEQRATFSFCEKVLMQKEEAERVRQGKAALPAPRQERRGGLRRGSPPLLRGARFRQRLRAHLRALPV